MSDQPLKVVAVVCPNGLGHFRRITEVLHRLAECEPSLQVELVCEFWQRERLRDSRIIGELEWGRRARWTHGLLTPGLTWSLDPSVYDDGRLRSWVQRLRRVESLFSADLVISDNMAEVLELRPDAVLMGSFLWSDVLGGAYPDHPQVMDFVASERDLLARHRPHMLCVEAMAMPGVCARTQAVPMSWMRSGIRPKPRPPSALPHRTRVAVLMGDTGAPDSLAVEITSALLAQGAPVSLPPRLFAQFQKRLGAALFQYRGVDYQSCDLVLCRPGLGAIHDCVFHSLPMALLSEPGNAELEHNADRAVGLGLGIKIGAPSSVDAIADRVLTWGASEVLSTIGARMGMMEMTGVDQAAAWLQNHVRTKTGTNAATV